MEKGKAEEEAGAAQQSLAEVLKKAGETLIPLLVSGASLIGFVAFAGAVIVWTRLTTVKVPPDQAIAAFPRGELVAIGASVLLLFGFFGALATVGAYLTDRAGRATRGMARTLFGVLVLECVAAVSLVPGASVKASVIGAAIVVVAIGVAVWATFVESFVDLPDVLHPRKSETEKPQPRSRVRLALSTRRPPRWRCLIPVGAWLHRWRSPLVRGVVLFLLAGQVLALVLLFLTSLDDSVLRGACLAFGAFLLFFLWRAESESPPDDTGRNDRLSPWIWNTLLHPFVLVSGALLAALTLAGLAVAETIEIDDSMPLGLAAALGLVLGVVVLREIAAYDRQKDIAEATEEAHRRAEEWASRRKRGKTAEGREGLLDRIAGQLPKEKRRRAELRAKEANDKAERLKQVRLARSRPYRLTAERRGIVVMGIAIGAAVVLPALVLEELWLAGALAIAAALCLGLWRIAALSKDKFVWLGLAVFISMPLFGTFLLMGRNLDDPQVQPIALIRSSDDADESLQGIYVTESSDRVYFANVATEGCTDEVVPNSGRLLWVSKSEVVAMSIGPSQDVDDAARSALEMSYALTSSVETPTGSRFDLDTSGKTPPAGGQKDESVKTRLESAGPAVRPSFGKGLRLDPEQAPPGSEVTLRMSVVDEANGEKGFGEARSGRTLRLGGVEVDIAKEAAGAPEDAEFAALADGRFVGLAKRTLYTKKWDGGEMVAIEDDQTEEEGTFVKLDDDAVVAVEEWGGGADEYLELGEDGRLTNETTVELKSGGEPVEVRPELMRQAWYPEHIRFIVPENAKNGEVTVECKQLAGQPLLRVVRDSTARITVRLQTGSQQVVFDSSHSGEEGGKVTSRRWTIAGRPMGGEEEVSADLPPRYGAYSVQLNVTNAEGESSSTELKLLRLPASLFKFGQVAPVKEGAIKDIRDVVHEAIEEADTPPTAIEIHGHADDVGSDAYNVRLSMERAFRVRKELLPGESSELTGVEDPLPGERIPVTIRAFGETCPIDRRSGPRQSNRRVEVFILERGAIVTTPDGCRAGRVMQLRW